MNFQHGQTIIWLRWRLACNQINRMSWINRALLYLLIVLSLIIGGSSFIVSLTVGIWILPQAWPDWMVFVWVGMVLAFLGSWMVGVLTDLQRSEPLSLDKFLHLPVSPQGVFCLNYFSSIFSLSLVVFFPMMIGWSFALAWKYQGLLWLGPLLTLAFFMMVTALTYQFRGWLAALMTNKRHKRTILTVITVVVILVSQIPNIVSNTVLRATGKENRQIEMKEKSERRSLDASLAADELQSEVYDKRLLELNRRKSERQQRQFAEKLGWARMANTYFPPLWLAAGMDAAAKNRWTVSLISCLGMVGLGSFGLWRSYQTTLRLFRGGFESRTKKKSSTSPGSSAKPILDYSGLSGSVASAWKPSWLEKSVPGANEHQAAVAWMSFRNLTRAPEAKLALITPIAVVILVGASMLFGNRQPISPYLRPLLGIGICFLAMAGTSQLIQNQFGFDRDGFRALLLAPISERNILIGKNLALAPIAMTLGLTALLIMQFCVPLHWSHFLATVFQLVTMYLVACLVSNLMSIVVPMGVAAGSLKPTNLKFGSVLLQILLFLLAPLGMVPAILPFGIEIWLANDPRWNWLPIYLMGAVFYLVLLAITYRWLIGYQAKLLAERKWRILETITRVSS